MSQSPTLVAWAAYFKYQKHGQEKEYDEIGEKVRLFCFLIIFKMHLQEWMHKEDEKRGSKREIEK